MASLKKRDLTYILQTLYDLPPFEWLDECATTDQRNHWLSVENYCIDLWSEWESIVQETESPWDNSDLSQYSAKLKAQEIFSLYLCLRAGWRRIQLPDVSLPTGEKIEFSSVRYAMRWIFLDHIRSIFVHCLKSDAKISPQAIYRFLLDDERQTGKLAEARRKTIKSHKDRTVIENHERKRASSLKDCALNEMGVEQISLQEVFEMALKPHTGATDIKPWWRVYLEWKEVRSKFIRSVLRDHKKHRGSRWKNGELSLLKKM